MESANRDTSAAIGMKGELVLLNTRQAGTRQPLNAPTMFIGREPGCEIRLNVDGIDSMHCLLINGADGVRIRDLKSTKGTFVNGVRTEHLLLQNGDVLDIGPFQFRVELPALLNTDSEREGLRIQVAAVVAQQIALDEEEIRLEKSSADLEQQEEQLAAHLAAKQLQLEEQSDRLKAEREALEADRLELKRIVAATDDAQARDHQKLASERQRVNKMHQRLRQRWHKHWAVEKEKHQKLANQLECERRSFEQKHAALREREAAFHQELVHFNTERELTLRQLHDGCDELKKEQERWHKRRSLELAVLEARRRDLDESQLRLTEARQLLVQEKEAWNRQQNALEKELHGINNRIVNQRYRLQEQEDEIARLESQRRDHLKALNGDGAAVAECEVEGVLDEASTWDPRINDLAQMASDLADQRTALVEQYERLAQIHKSWHEERARAARDLDALAERLVADEQSLALRQAQTVAEEQSLRDRQAEVESVRQEIVILQAQLKTREQMIEEEHARELEALRQKEAMFDEQLANLTQIRHRWNTRRHEELGELQTSRADLAREQSAANADRSELFAKRQQLVEERSVVAEKSLALEEYWQEVTLRANDPAAQERVERLRRRWLSLNAAIIANARNENASATQRLEKLEECRSQLEAQLHRLTRDKAALAEQHTLLDEREAKMHARQIRLDDEVRKLEHQKNEPERHGLLLHKDAEAVAKVVFEDHSASPIDRAA